MCSKYIYKTLWLGNVEKGAGLATCTRSVRKYNRFTYSLFLLLWGWPPYNSFPIFTECIAQRNHSKWRLLTRTRSSNNVLLKLDLVHDQFLLTSSLEFTLTHSLTHSLGWRWKGNASETRQPAALNVTRFGGGVIILTLLYEICFSVTCNEAIM